MQTNKPIKKETWEKKNKNTTLSTHYKCGPIQPQIVNEKSTFDPLCTSTQNIDDTQMIKCVCIKWFIFIIHNEIILSLIVPFCIITLYYLWLKIRNHMGNCSQMIFSTNFPVRICDTNSRTQFTIVKNSY